MLKTLKSYFTSEVASTLLLVCDNVTEYTFVKFEMKSGTWGKLI